MGRISGNCQAILVSRRVPLTSLMYARERLLLQCHTFQTTHDQPPLCVVLKRMEGRSIYCSYQACEIRQELALTTMLTATRRTGPKIRSFSEPLHPWTEVSSPSRSTEVIGCDFLIRPMPRYHKRSTRRSQYVIIPDVPMSPSVCQSQSGLVLTSRSRPGHWASKKPKRSNRSASSTGSEAIPSGHETRRSNITRGS